MGRNPNDYLSYQRLADDSERSNGLTPVVGSLMPDLLDNPMGSCSHFGLRLSHIRTPQLVFFGERILDVELWIIGLNERSWAALVTSMNPVLLPAILFVHKPHE